MAKIGRNDPCPCGSGKKYKKCCGPLGKYQSVEAVSDLEEKPWLDIDSDEFEDDPDLAGARERLLSLQRKLGTPEVEDRMVEAFERLEAILKFDPMYVHMRLEMHDVFELMRLTADARSLSDARMIESQEAAVRQVIRGKQHQQLSDGWRDIVDDDVLRTHDLVHQLALMHASEDLYDFERHGRITKGMAFWLTLATICVQAFYVYALNERGMTRAYLRRLIESGAGVERHGIQGLSFEEAWKEILADDGVFHSVTDAKSQIEGDLGEAIYEGRLIIEMPDDWVTYLFALPAFRNVHSRFSPEYWRETQEEEIDTLAEDAVCPQLIADCGTAFLKALETVPADDPLRIPLAFCAEVFPVNAVNAGSYMARNCLLQKCRDAMDHPERYETVRLFFEKVSRDPDTLLEAIETARNEGNLSRAAALALAGSSLFENSPDPRFLFADLAARIGAEKTEEDLEEDADWEDEEDDQEDEDDEDDEER